MPLFPISQRAFLGLAKWRKGPNWGNGLVGSVFGRNLEAGRSRCHSKAGHNTETASE